MCYVLYVGTEQGLPLKAWNPAAPDLSVAPLGERDRPVAAHFSRPVVQYVGSTSSCGCDFPFAIYYDENNIPHPSENELEATNRAGLAALLRATGEREIELYGLWDGDFANPPTTVTEIELARILEADFCFDEGGFYVVKIGDDESHS